LRSDITSSFILFFYEDGNDNLYNERRDKALDPMKGILTETADLNIVLQMITSRQTCLAFNPANKIVEKEFAKQPKAVKSPTSIYNKHNDREKERPIDRMIETPEVKGKIARFAREFDINSRTAERW
jgi:hypothetical protein